MGFSNPRILVPAGLDIIVRTTFLAALFQHSSYPCLGSGVVVPFSDDHEEALVFSFTFAARGFQLRNSSAWLCAECCH